MMMANPSARGGRLLVRDDIADDLSPPPFTPPGIAIYDAVYRPSPSWHFLSREDGGGVED